MTRYIAEGDIYDLLQTTGTGRIHVSQIDVLPRADVVPKSEVKRIFVELYESVASKIPPYIHPIFKDDRNFEDGFRDGKTDALIEVLGLIASLKKKYTEAKSDE